MLTARWISLRMFDGSVPMMMLLRGGDTLIPRAWERLERVFRTEDPTDELSAAGGIKEQLRRLLATDTLAQAWGRMRMGCFVQIANMPVATKLYDTVVTWWDAIEVLIGTSVITARVEDANAGIKNIKRTGRGFHNATTIGMLVQVSCADYC